MIIHFFTTEELVFLEGIKVLSPAELHGFLLGLVITPASIPFTIWSQHLLDRDKMFSLQEVEIAHLKSYLADIHERISSFSSHDDMSYSFLELDPNMDIAAVFDWARGLWGAMEVTPGYWDIDKFIKESSDDLSAVSAEELAHELSEERAQFYVCRHIVYDVAHPLTTIDSYDSEDAGVENLLKDIGLLGSAVYALGERCKGHCSRPNRF